MGPLEMLAGQVFKKIAFKINYRQMFYKAKLKYK